MYEKMELTKIGEAKSLIRGISMMGIDPDGSDFPLSFEFEADEEERF